MHNLLLDIGALCIVAVLASALFTFIAEIPFQRAFLVGLFGVCPGVVLGIFAPMPPENRFIAILYFAVMSEVVSFYVYWTTRQGVNPVV
jgi:hypothetical protein